MGKLFISAGTSGITSDEVTASKADVLAGKTALTSDSNDEAVAGTLPDKTGTVQEGAAVLDGTNARLTLTIPAAGKYTGTSKLFATYARIASLIGLTAAKIMKGNTILNIAGTATSDATAGDTDILSGKTAYVNGSKKTGTMANVPNTSSVTLTASDGRKVIKQDASSNALWVTGNSDNVRRALIQVPTTGYYTNNTVIGVPEARMATAGGVTAAKLLKGQSAFSIAGTATSDATAADTDILKGKTAYVNGSKRTGTMKNITGDTTIKFAASNSTPVVLADERYIDNNTDGVRRMCLRYMGTNGYITGNTLFGLPAQTKTVNPSVSDQNVGPDARKLLEKVVVKGYGEAYKRVKLGTINKTNVGFNVPLIDIPLEYHKTYLLIENDDIVITTNNGKDIRYLGAAVTAFPPFNEEANKYGPIVTFRFKSGETYAEFDLGRTGTLFTWAGRENISVIKKFYADIYVYKQI